MKMMNKLKKYAPNLSNAIKVGAGGVLMISASAYAALPESAKTSLEGAKADGLEAGWIVVGVVAALFVIKIVKGLIR